MDFPDATGDSGPPNALSVKEIKSMLKVAKCSSKDVFCDLGSGYGRPVRMAVSYARVKEAMGIENNPERYCCSRYYAKKYLSRTQLKKVEFILADMQDLRSTKATVVYHGHLERGGEVKMYRKIFNRKRLRIIRRDLPLVSYKPIAANRNNPRAWFFSMQYPLEKYKTKNKDEWASYVLGRSDAKIEDVYRYYLKQLKQRHVDERDSTRSLRLLKKLVRSKF